MDTDFHWQTRHVDHLRPIKLVEHLHSRGLIRPHRPNHQSGSGSVGVSGKGDFYSPLLSRIFGAVSTDVISKRFAADVLITPRYGNPTLSAESEDGNPSGKNDAGQGATRSVGDAVCDSEALAS